MHQSFKPLTDAMIETLRSSVGDGPRVEISDKMQKGLRLRLGPRSATWSMVLEVDGKRTRHAVGDWPEVGAEEARRIAHSLKGVSATLGAVHINQASIALEQAIRDNAESTTLLPLIDRVEEAYHALHSQLAAHQESRVLKSA